MAAHILDDMALKNRIFTLRNFFGNFFSKNDGNSRASPQCEIPKIFFRFLKNITLVFCPANMNVVPLKMAEIFDFEFSKNMS